LHPDLAGTFANVRNKGPPANTGFWWSFGFGIRFPNAAPGAANVKSSPLTVNLPR
jgi:hypothetical protein